MEPSRRQTVVAPPCIKTAKGYSWLCGLSSPTSSHGELYSMNLENFTQKVNKALAVGQELTMEAGHTQYTLAHLILVLLGNSEGLLRQAVTSAFGNEGTIAYVDQALKNTMNRFPLQSPTPEASPPNPALIKCMRSAQSLQKSRGDLHLAVHQFIVALLDDGQISDSFKEASVSSTT